MPDVYSVLAIRIVGHEVVGFDGVELQLPFPFRLFQFLPSPPQSEVQGRRQRESAEWVLW